jgi:hypothetical protein
MDFDAALARAGLPPPGSNRGYAPEQLIIQFMLSVWCEADSKDQLLHTPKQLEAHHRISHSFHGAVVLLDDIVAIFGLSKFDLTAGVNINTFDCGGIGSTFVDGDLLGQSV